MIVLLVMIGFAFGAQPLLGYNYGAHNTKRLKEIIKFDLFVEITFAVITSIILALFTPSFIKIFMNDPSIIQAGTLMLRFFAFIFSLCRDYSCLYNFISIRRKSTSCIITFNR